ncbi:hypothetical protein SCLCIDRAFT_1174433 [Scleroderma citrinum Foug A]|uniref:Uncharacterized protein n=1 Tax=Scleroderma citrinum Foug A TaxID=1036808 RepID=A0A0C3ADW3_9AGAM|nr:hypothetical protein SCLCIDRAFT_1174433 [Scleroderma citrinum Foug A]
MFAQLIVGLHHSMKQWLRIWLRSKHCMLVSFLYHIDSSKSDAFSQKRWASHIRKYIPLNNMCSKIPSTQCSDDVNTIVVELPQFTSASCKIT